MSENREVKSQVTAQEERTAKIGKGAGKNYDRWEQEVKETAEN